MDRFLIWPNNPLLSALVTYLVALVLLYPARAAVHRLVTSVARAISGGLRVLAKTVSHTAKTMAARNREVLLESGRADMERKIEHQFERMQAGFARDLKQYPELHKKLDAVVTQLEEDFVNTRAEPPQAPGWPDAVKAVSSVPEMGDRAGKKILAEIKRAAQDSEKQALREYREVNRNRHRVLSAMAPVWKEVRSTAGSIHTLVSHALGFASRIDAHMERYEKIRHSDDAAIRLLASSASTHMLVALVAMTVACAGAFLNFQLIALPMSELVPSGTRILGVPMASLAALVLVFMEATAGLFVMEALGVTDMLPQVGRLPPGTRRLLLVVSGLGLLALAGIECSLAVLREQIVDADMMLKQQLAAGALTPAARSNIPVVGQATLGFILPWLLAVMALPLQMLIQNGRHVVGGLVVGGLHGVSAVLRATSHGVRHVLAALGGLFDILVAVPTQIHAWWQGRGRVGTRADAPGRKDTRESRQEPALDRSLPPPRIKATQRSSEVLS